MRRPCIAGAGLFVTGSLVVGCALLLLPGCDDGKPSAPAFHASLVVRARIVQSTAKTQQSAQTTWDSLVVRVVSSGGDTICSSLRLQPGDAVLQDTLSGVPAENGLRVDAYTVDRSGRVVHRCDAQTVNLLPGETRQVNLWLTAVCGSIYIELIDVPTSVATVQACFAFGQDTLCTQKPRATRMFLAIDYVSDGASGLLIIAGVDGYGDTLYRSELQLTFYSDRNTTLSASFLEPPGGLSLQATIVQPAVTVVAASMGSTEPPDSEQGPLIISEIMYAANHAEYVELYNPTAVEVALDSLVLEKDGVRRYLLDVAIAPGGFFVIARNDSPWADTSLSFLDLSSTTGNWLAVRDKAMTLMDWVAYPGGNNDVGWPKPAATEAIVLDSLPADPAYNNYGAHWRVAESPIGGGSLKGTPGMAGR